MMNEILVNIREEIGEVNLINSCGGRGCRVDMVDVPSERIIVNVDTAFPAHQIAGKRCDRILVYGDTTRNRLVVVLLNSRVERLKQQMCAPNCKRVWVCFLT